MKKIFLHSLLVISTCAFAQNDALRNKANQSADKIESKVIAWRRDFHEHPELGNNEYRTASIIAKHLQSLGIEVKTGVAKTGVVGILNGATAEVKIPYTSHYPVTFNDVALTEKMLPSLRKTAGTENVLLKSVVTGAEDFSFYQQKAPGLFFFLGGMPKGQDPKTAPSHHTPDFYIDESGFKLGVKALTNLVLDYMDMAKK